jgi:hypothetical protein
MIWPGGEETTLAAHSRQKKFAMRRTKICLRVLALICAVCSCAWAQDPGWPRKLVKPAGTVLVYQPQVDDWQNFIDIKWESKLLELQASKPRPRSTPTIIQFCCST